MKKKEAAIEYLASVMLICFTGLLIILCCKYKEIKLHQIKIRDSIDISVLAAAIIDKDELDETGNIHIDGVVKAREVFEKTLKENLVLNDNMEPVGEKPFDKVVIHKFTVYRITDEHNIIIFDIDNNQHVYTVQIPYDGTQKTPDGKLIESETVYVDVGTYIDGLFNQKKYEHITTCVDIVSQNI